MMKLLLVAILWLCFLQILAQEKDHLKAVFIENKSWTLARTLLNDTTIVVLPLGAEAKEHGPRLLLKKRLAPCRIPEIWKGLFLE